MKMKKQKKGGDPQKPSSLEEELLKMVFGNIERDADEWLEENESEEFSDAGQFWDFLEEQFYDDDFYKDLGHVSASWLENNIEYVFEKYKARPIKSKPIYNQPKPIVVTKASDLFGKKK